MYYFLFHFIFFAGWVTDFFFPSRNDEIALLSERQKWIFCSRWMWKYTFCKLSNFMSMQSFFCLVVLWVFLILQRCSVTSSLISFCVTLGINTIESENDRFWSVAVDEIELFWLGFGFEKNFFPNLGQIQRKFESSPTPNSQKTFPFTQKHAFPK